MKKCQFPRHKTPKHITCIFWNITSLVYYQQNILPQTNHSTSLVYFDLTFPWSLIHLRPAAKVSSPKQGCCHRAYVFSARKSHLKLIFWSLAIQSVFLPTLRYYLIWPTLQMEMAIFWASDQLSKPTMSKLSQLSLARRRPWSTHFFCAWIQLTVSMQSWCKLLVNAAKQMHVLFHISKM